jgi:hypothetical protein
MGILTCNSAISDHMSGMEILISVGLKVNTKLGLYSVTGKFMSCMGALRPLPQVLIQFRVSLIRSPSSIQKLVFGIVGTLVRTVLNNTACEIDQSHNH